MAEEDDSAEDRTLDPTPRRLEQAREQGNVPISRELASLLALAAATLAANLAGSDMTRTLTSRLSLFIANADATALAGPEAFRQAAQSLMDAATPIVLAVLAAGAGAVLVQTRFLLSGHALQPNLARISPMAGLRRLFGPDNLLEAIRSSLKLIAISLSVWWSLRDDVTGLADLSFLDPRTALLPRIGALGLRVLKIALVVQMVAAILDLVWVHLRYRQKLRMSRHDMTQEQKETEGNPRVKQRMRQIRVARARQRMMAAVPKATVVITNPTHYAVALTYDRAKSSAPRVVAKGVDSMAARIRKMAEKHRVPLVANPPLARALYTVALDTEIPAEHYKAVAEIIAYVWRLEQAARERRLT